MNKTMRQAIKLGRQIASERVVCTSCSGSGVYDVKGSPKCAACNGTGYINKEKTNEH